MNDFKLGDIVWFHYNHRCVNARVYKVKPDVLLVIATRNYRRVTLEVDREFCYLLYRKNLSEENLYYDKTEKRPDNDSK